MVRQKELSFLSLSYSNLLLLPLLFLSDQVVKSSGIHLITKPVRGLTLLEKFRIFKHGSIFLEAAFKTGFLNIFLLRFETTQDN